MIDLDIAKQETVMVVIYQSFILSLLLNKDGSNASEYALIMSLVAIFIITGVIGVSTALGGFFTSMSICLNDTPNCSGGLF